MDERYPYSGLIPCSHECKDIQLQLRSGDFCNCVLILVLMDVRISSGSSTETLTSGCLNPCFNGCKDIFEDHPDKGEWRS